MTRDEIVDFLEWAKECGQLQFPESRKVDMAEMYIKEHIGEQLNILHVSRAFYCQSEIEGNRKCTHQCEHCKEYYKPLEQ